MDTKTVQGTRKKICSKCKQKNGKLIEEFAFVQGLPIWRDGTGKIHYELPPCLARLSEAEKLLIAPYLVYIPLQHISKGQHAIKGHVCCFPQVRRKVLII